MSMLPDLVRVRQKFPERPQFDATAALTGQWTSMRAGERIVPGARVALTAGSRGVRDLVPVLRTLARLVDQAGGRPFVVPCMGSHGGRRPPGRPRLLRAWASRRRP